MNFYPIVMNGKQQLYSQEFRGLNRTERVADGELAAMENMSSDRYPVLSPRKKRRLRWRPSGFVSAMLTKAVGGARASLFYAVENAGRAEIWKDGERLTCMDSLLEGKDPTVTRMVSMGAYIVVFPQQVWLDTSSPAVGGYACGSMNNTFEVVLTKEDYLQLIPCDREGNSLQSVTASKTEPENPTGDMTWIDTGSDTPVAKRWSVTQRIWVVLEGVYTKLRYPGIAEGFSKGDGVVISGLVTRYLMPNQIIEAVDQEGDYIVVTGLTNSIGAVTKDPFTVERKCPDMNYVVEAGNRLWGCYYGPGEDGKPLNEIYACALGDFKNWRKYQGVSTDSYTASRGSDGRWTGAVTFHGRPTFFKENYMEVVYPSSSGAHEIVSTECRGLQGSVRQGGLAVVDDILYYFTGTEVMAYDGTQPVSISGALGRMSNPGACGWGYNHKLYLGLAANPDTEARNELLVYDTRLQVWHREDNIIPNAMAGDGSVLYLSTHTGIWEADWDGVSEAPEPDFQWSAETGDYGLSSPNRAYTSRFLLRLSMLRGSWADLYIQYDSTGVWEHQGHIVCGPWLQTVSVPVIPRRCDHLRFKLVGHGDCKLFAIARQVKEGSDILW